MNEIKLDLNLQIREAIEQVMSELEMGERPNVDTPSCERHRSQSRNDPNRIWGNASKSNKDSNMQS